MTAGCVAGGFAAGHYVQKIDPAKVRPGIGMLAIGMTLYFFWHAYGPKGQPCEAAAGSGVQGFRYVAHVLFIGDLVFKDHSILSWLTSCLPDHRLRRVRQVYPLQRSMW